MPDVMNAKTNRAFGTYAKNEFSVDLNMNPISAVLSKNPKSVAEQMGHAASNRYIYSMAVMRSWPMGLYYPDCIVMLEARPEDGPVLSVFDRQLVHHNLGVAPSLTEESKFIERALEIIKREFPEIDEFTE